MCPHEPLPTGDKIRVMVVDDSAVIRGFIVKILQSDPTIEVVASSPNGQSAVNTVKDVDPDVVTLDIEMPVMDGLAAIPELLKQKPNLKIIMCSTLTTQNGASTLKAMSLGAVDCIAKPTSVQEIYSQENFKNSLLERVRYIGRAQRKRRVREAAPVEAESAGKSHRITETLHPKLPKEVKLRPSNEGFHGKPHIVAIGSSTGGPQALFKVIKHFKDFDVPMVLTQHMPPTFTKILAEHIQSNTGVKSMEGAEGMVLEKGQLYVAPGGSHMVILTKDGKPTIHIDDGPMENFCKPAVDPMLRSLLPIYGEKILTVILTGMGTDGHKGSKLVVERGGRVVAQDEASSVVWGMPGAVALDGLCSAVLPVDEIGPYVRQAVLRM